MEMSEQNVELFGALAAFHAQVEPPKKSSTNPHFRSKYADLSEVLETVRGPLTANGLVLTQFPEDSDRDSVTITTMIVHKSGQWMRSSLKMPAKYAAQEFGSAISYARRYAALAMLGLAAEDDDGEAAHGRGKAAQKAPAKTLDDVAKTREGVANERAPFVEYAQEMSGTEGPDTGATQNGRMSAKIHAYQGSTNQTETRAHGEAIEEPSMPTSTCPAFKLGKHKGKLVMDVPAGYLRWVAGEQGFAQADHAFREWVRYGIAHHEWSKQNGAEQ